MVCERPNLSARLRAALILFACAAAPAGAAIAADSQLRSIALLWSHSGCAPTVSIAPGTFFVGAAALDVACPGAVCDRVKLYVPVGDGSGEMVRLRSPQVSVARRVDSLGVASLAVSSPDLAYVVPVAIAEPAPGAVVRVLDFPDCEALMGRYGVVGREGAIGFATTVPAHTVQHGAIVLDEQAGVVGIVGSRLLDTQAVPRWLARLILFPLRVTRASAARAVLTGDERQSLSAEVALWNRVYDERLAAGGAVDRLQAAPAFRAGVGLVAARALTVEAGRPVADALAASHQLGLSFISRFGPAAAGSLGAQGERLAVAYALATRGLLGPRLEPIDVDAILAGLGSSARSAAQIASLEAMVAHERRSNPFAPVGSLTVLVAVLAVGALILTAAWGWSLGVVFKAARGGIALRSAKAALVALALWPASLLVFWLLGTLLRRRRESQALALVPDGWTL